ncbi:hypothetical protein SprV_0401624300 [Sparganum proliferum]
MSALASTLGSLDEAEEAPTGLGSAVSVATGEPGVSHLQQLTLDADVGIGGGGFIFCGTLVRIETCEADAAFFNPSCPNGSCVMHIPFQPAAVRNVGNGGVKDYMTRSTVYRQLSGVLYPTVSEADRRHITTRLLCLAT